ncbi:hypothetical protein FQA39_LY08613 [Lamprigera yunnana]|nr:hypothetical protein FQA39_LY08613 [Lamprigera yunnana]
MHNLFDRLSILLSPQERFKIILRNTHTSIQDKLALVDIGSVEELLNFGRKIKEVEQRKRHIQNNQNNGKEGRLEPDLVYIETCEKDHGRQIAKNSARSQTGTNEVTNASPGIRGGGSVDVRLLVPETCVNPNNIDIPIQSKCYLDFILMHVQGDGRPYFNIGNFGVKIVGLLD